MSGADCYHWEAKRKQRTIDRQREAARTAALLSRERQSPAERPRSSESRPGTSASRPGTAESGEIANNPDNNQTRVENGVQRREHTTDISPAKLKRRLSDLDYEMQW
ncbi:uncharacterized protein [Dysidea avara]|uniref:uncharacterized protein n=1 Tax=Dysidea avara TaxID=196820 RepID=UPI00331D1346